VTVGGKASALLDLNFLVLDRRNISLSHSIVGTDICRRCKLSEYFQAIQLEDRLVWFESIPRNFGPHRYRILELVVSIVSHLRYECVQ
jgi:hypothetical protein